MQRNGHQDIVAYLRDHGAEKLSVPPISALLAKADPKSGKELFRLNCDGCHLLTGVLNTVGPKLLGVVGRKKASGENFTYSPPLKEESGTWTYEELNIFISDPAPAVPGTDMRFPGLQDEKQRADVIAYLRTLSDTPLALPAQ